MNFYVDKIQKFFESVAKYFYNSGYNSFSWLFIIFMGLFGLTTIFIIASASTSYEYQLTRAIDKINKFLSKNPRINDDNLITFNNKMKERSIPKALRRQWQQFMLYREHEASYYMSFKHCVENPLKNSSFSQRLRVYKVISMILVVLSVLLGVYCTSVTTIGAFLRDIIIIPIFILVVYWIISMILGLIHSATTGDLYQNYQYFEINMDKATNTLPEYVDYEVLFTQDEIKRGIPVLFEYIQKRAIEEQKELERARIKNVEHEKFNFDEAGLDASLVLERSMQEAENYIATRKKFMQDIEQVNNEISALENQYKENVKENQKLMQTSKESIEGLKKQLEQATSSIEINYIKKQMKDELNRQQVAERDFDTLTDKFNKETKELHNEVDNLQGEIDKAKKDLEDSMMSEFSTYSTKVYEKLEKVAKENDKETIEGYIKRINELEERLDLKDAELDNVYSQYQSQVSKLKEKSEDFEDILREKDDTISEVQEQLEQGEARNVENEDLVENFEEDIVDENQEEQFNEFDEESFDESQETGLENFDTFNDLESESQDEFNYLSDENGEENFNQDTIQEESDLSFNYKDSDESEENTQFNYKDEEAEEKPVDKVETEESDEESDDETSKLFDSWLNEEDEEEGEGVVARADEEDAEYEEGEEVYDDEEIAEDIEQYSLENEEDGEYLDESIENDEEYTDEEDSEAYDSLDNTLEEEEEYYEDEEEDLEEQPVRRVGRPRKIVDESQIKPKRGPGRPRKIVNEKTRPESNLVRRVGRPRKEETVQTRPVGRPRKTEVEEKRSVGRPKGSVVRKVGRPRKPRPVGRPRKANPVGRPRKDSSKKNDNLIEIDKKLKELNAQIKRENKNFTKTKKQIEQANIKKRKARR